MSASGTIKIDGRWCGHGAKIETVIVYGVHASEYVHIATKWRFAMNVATECTEE